MNPSAPRRYTPQSATRQVRARSQEAVAYHYDDQKPGKPLWLIIPGAMAAITSLVLGFGVAYFTFQDPRLDQTLGTFLCVGFIPFYIMGVFVFSYGWELYDIAKAIRLTAIIVVVTFFATFMLVAVVAILGALGKSKSSSSDSSRSFSSRSSSSGGGSRGGGLLDGIGPIFINAPSTQTVTREIVREVPVEPPAPEPIPCEYCGRPYIPEENKYACPNCGAPTPAELGL
jgi:hypothetical protein